MTKTTNYQLPKWEKTDRIQMKDFNDMTATLDAALAAKSRVACGVYTGDGTASRTIDLDFTPKAVLVSCDNAASYTTASNNITYQELICRGWFLHSNTYDCGSFVVN